MGFKCKVVRETLLGYQTILGADFPRIRRVRRDQRPGRRPSWIVETICNGVAEGSAEYTTLRAAVAAWEGR